MPAEGSAACRYWMLAYGRACGPVLISTFDGPPRLPGREGSIEIIDRLSPALEPFKPYVCA